MANEGNGSVVVELQEGDVFKLGVLGEDLCCGNGELTISDFTFPSFSYIDTLTCNYNDASTTDDGSCVYPVDCEVCSGTDGTGYVMDGIVMAMEFVMWMKLLAVRTKLRVTTIQMLRMTMKRVCL